MTSNLGCAGADRPNYDLGERSMLKTRQSKATDLAQLGLDALAPFVSGEPSTWSVLDVGSGFGQTSFALGGFCAEVVGLEPTTGRYHHAVRVGAEENGQHKNVTFRNHGVEDRAEVERFDVVFLDNVLEHLPDQGKALCHIAKSLKRGGAVSSGAE